MNNEVQNLITEYKNLVKELRSNKVSISEEEARKGIKKN